MLDFHPVVLDTTTLVSVSDAFPRALVLGTCRQRIGERFETRDEFSAGTSPFCAFGLLWGCLGDAREQGRVFGDELLALEGGFVVVEGSVRVVDGGMGGEGFVGGAGSLGC